MMDGTFIDVVINKVQWLLEHPEVTWSGSGIYALSLAGSAALAVAACVVRRKKKSPPSSEEHTRQPLPAQKTDNQFNSGGGEQNIAQGDHATGKLVNNHGSVISTSGNQSPAVNAQTVTITYGVAQEKYDQIKKDLDIGDAAFASFFKILEQGSIPREEWGAKLPEIAFRYKELLLRFEAITSDDPQVKSLKEQARQAIEDGEYDRADALLNQAKERDRAAEDLIEKSIEEEKVALEKRKLSRAESCVDQANLQRLQYRYEKSAQYYQEAAAALPEGYEWDRAECLSNAGYDLLLIARYADALRLCEQSLSIECDIGDLKQIARSLNNISQIYEALGEYGKTLEYLKQSITILRKLGDKKGEGAALNNISRIYDAKRDYPNALKYLEQSLLLQREANDKETECITINNIGEIHREQGDYAAALGYYEQALAISRELDDKATASKVLGNVGLVYKTQGKLDAAMEHYEQSLAITRQIGDRRGEGTTLNNIGKLYEAKENYAAALKQYEQALAIVKEIGEKNGEATYSWNTGALYIQQGELAEAESYLSRAVELAEQLEDPDLEGWRMVLEAVRTKLYGRTNLFVRVFRSLFRGR